MTDSETSTDKTIAALVCDMDGLLIDSEPVADRSMGVFLARHGRETGPELIPLLLGRRLPEAVAIVQRHFGIEGALPDLIQEYDQLRTEMLRGNLEPLPGAAEILRFARGAGLKLALATSNRAHQKDISLQETHLAGLFDVEVTGDEVERGKPEPDIFLLAAERLGTAPGACVVLEDAPAGVAAAAAAGMRCLLVPNAYSLQAGFAVPPTATLTSLHEAIAWLQTHGVTMRG